jgi:hypothetical protein
VQVFFERLTLEERIAERVAKSSDGVGEDVVEHEFTLQVCENRGCGDGDLRSE